MFIIRIAALLIAVHLLAAQASAQSVQEGQRAIDLMWACQGRGELYDTFSKMNAGDGEVFGSFDILICVAYLAGITDMNALNLGILGTAPFCFPKSGIAAEQQILIFIKWANQNPDKLHESRRSGVVSAFAEAFPCQR